MTASDAGPASAGDRSAADELAEVMRPWLPAALRGPEEKPLFDHKSVKELSYVLVDEILDNLVALSVSPWPEADGRGRLRFTHAADRGHIVVHKAELDKMLYRGWLRREPRTGDAFATVVAPQFEARLAAGDDVTLGSQLRLVDVLRNDVYDLSSESRRVAKLAYYAAMAPVVPGTLAAQRGQDKAADTQTRTAAPHQLPQRAWKGPHVPEPIPAEQLPWQLPTRLLQAAKAGDFALRVKEQWDALVYFLLNVGDGDSQVVLLPAPEPEATRRALIVDVATTRKVTGLLGSLEKEGLLPDLTHTADVFPVVVATHPHDDHIGGMPEFLDQLGRARQVRDFWEPGYYQPSAAFVETMALLEEVGVARTQPTSGTTRWTSGVKITALSPSVALRVRYDSYGVDINDSSIALKIEFPAARVTEQLTRMRQERNRQYLRLDSPWTLILGADAQTTSWAHVTADFPELHRQYDTALYRELGAARGRDYLRAQIFKVSHHASKHGINLELVERIQPDLALVSSVCGGGKYNFPHALAAEAIREAMQRTTSKNTARLADHELGIHYTGATADTPDRKPIGSIAIVLSPKRQSRPEIWRFGDDSRELIDLDRAVRFRRTA